MKRWHLWLGHEERGKCIVCGRKFPVLRYTNGDDAVWVCWWHRRVVPTEGS